MYVWINHQTIFNLSPNIFASDYVCIYAHAACAYVTKSAMSAKIGLHTYVGFILRSVGWPMLMYISALLLESLHYAVDYTVSYVALEMPTSLKEFCHEMQIVSWSHWNKLFMRKLIFYMQDIVWCQTWSCMWKQIIF